MALLHWTSDLEVGIEEIDKQHQQLVNYIIIYMKPITAAAAKKWVKHWMS